MRSDTSMVALVHGRVRGLPGPVRRFLGIPYAKPPVGPRRWQPPAMLEPWSGMLDATGFGSDSFQLHDSQLRGRGLSEDCLYLNVWTPSQGGLDRLPVMVWIHGNGYTRGSGSHATYDGTQLASRGVVVVTVNYRLGLAGFLAHPELTAESANGSSGNYGLLDQLAALRWVQENIQSFGGDPRRVTLFGQSAGATCTQLLMASPMGKSLCSQAILHSPGSMRPMARLADAEHAGLRLGQSVQELRRLPISALWPKASLLVPPLRSLASPRGMGPIVDGWVVSGDDIANYREGCIPPMPLLIGTTANEGRRLTERMPMRTAADVSAYEASSFGGLDKVPAAYRLSGPSDDESALAVLDQVVGDTQFNYGAWSSAREMQRIGGRVYRYRFDRPIRGGSLAPTHDDELPYVFGTLVAGDLWCGPQDPASVSAADRRLSDLMGDAWTAFARSGAPRSDGLPTWPEATDGAVMVFDESPALARVPPSAGLTSLQQYFGHGEPDPRILEEIEEA